MTHQAPRRIQLRRTKGWRKPEGAVVVARPTRWGNPILVHQHTGACGEELETCRAWASPFTAGLADTRQQAVTRFRHCYEFPMIGDPVVPDVDDIRGELAGKDLACWCPLEDAQGNRVPCHADVLLEIANPGLVIP